jgi:hypothetical protein
MTTKVSSVSVLHAGACDFADANSQCLVVLTDIDPNLHDDYLLESLEINVKVSATGQERGSTPYQPKDLTRIGPLVLTLQSKCWK